MFFCRLHHGGRFHVAAQVDHGVAVVFQQDLDNILADVVDIPLDGGQNNGPLWGGFPAWLGGKPVSDDLKRCLRRSRGLDKLGQEDPARLKVRTHLIQGGDEDIVHHRHAVHRLQELLGGGRGLAL